MGATKQPQPQPVPPPQTGTGKPPKPNEIDLITLIDDFIENAKGPQKGGKN